MNEFLVVERSPSGASKLSSARTEEAACSTMRSLACAIGNTVRHAPRLYQVREVLPRQAALDGRLVAHMVAASKGSLFASFDEAAQVAAAVEAACAVRASAAPLNDGFVVNIASTPDGVIFGKWHLFSHAADPSLRPFSDLTQLAAHLRRQIADERRLRRD
jgi:hypothetical protein